MLTYHFIKRVFDLITSVLLMIALSPLFICLAALIKTSSKGPVFYPSPRLGLKGSTIRCWKFRTMHVDADKTLKKLLIQSSELRREWSLYQKLKKDPRVISCGHLLRKASLDELPQLWNVFKGEMSLIGPRPFLKDQMDSLPSSTARCLLSVKPGLSGLWQVSGRNLISFEEKIKLDLEYVQQINFWTDIKIFFKTFPVLLSSKGAY